MALRSALSALALLVRAPDRRARRRYALRSSRALLRRRASVRRRRTPPPAPRTPRTATSSSPPSRSTSRTTPTAPTRWCFVTTTRTRRVSRLRRSPPAQSSLARARARAPPLTRCALQVIAGRTMGEWLRFSVAFWHTFRGDGADPFGAATKARVLRQRRGVQPPHRHPRRGAARRERACAARRGAARPLSRVPARRSPVLAVERARAEPHGARRGGDARQLRASGASPAPPALPVLVCCAKGAPHPATAATLTVLLSPSPLRRAAQAGRRLLVLPRPRHRARGACARGAAASLALSGNHARTFSLLTRGALAHAGRDAGGDEREPGQDRCAGEGAARRARRTLLLLLRGLS